MTGPTGEAGTADIGADLLREMEAHARETYPDECCGVVVAIAGAAPAVLRLRNVQNELHAKDPARFPRTARTAYVPHADDLRRALDCADRPGGRLIAFYHSHPEHDAYFSETDVTQAAPEGEPWYPDAIQVVVSVYGREVRDVKAYRWSERDARYVEALLARG